MLSHYFNEYTIRENVRPEWLTSPEGTRLELDFYIEEIDIAIEVQGRQHYVYVSHFYADHEAFKRRLLLDRIKRETCTKAQVELIEISSISDAREIIPFLAHSSNGSEWNDEKREQYRRIARGKLYAMRATKKTPTWANFRRLENIRRKLRKEHMAYKEQGNEAKRVETQKSLQVIAGKIRRSRKKVHKELVEAFIRFMSNDKYDTDEELEKKKEERFYAEAIHAAMVVNR